MIGYPEVVLTAKETQTAAPLDECKADAVKTVVAFLRADWKEMTAVQNEERTAAATAQSHFPDPGAGSYQFSLHITTLEQCSVRWVLRPDEVKALKEVIEWLQYDRASYEKRFPDSPVWEAIETLAPRIEVMRKPEEGFFRDYTNTSLLSYVRSGPDGDPFELQLEAIREGRRRVDAGRLDEFSFKQAMDANFSRQNPPISPSNPPSFKK